MDAYGVFFVDLLLLRLPYMLRHLEATREASVALLDGVLVALAQEILGDSILGLLLVGGGVLEQLVDGAVGNLLNCRLDKPYNGSEGLLELLGALVGGLELGRLVDLVAASTAGRGLLLGGLSDLAVLVASPAAASPASGARASGRGGLLGGGWHVDRHGVVHLRGVDGLGAALAHDGNGGRAVGRVAVDGG